MTHRRRPPPKDAQNKEYFAYVKVADIPYPEHPTDTGAGWHSTGTSPEEMEELMKRFEPMLRVVRERDGDSEPDHAYWLQYWRKHDKAIWRLFDGNRGMARCYQTFFGWDQCRVIKYGERYEPESGYHRIWFAKKMGFEVLPVLVIEQDEP